MEILHRQVIETTNKYVEKETAFYYRLVYSTPTLSFYFLRVKGLQECTYGYTD